MRAPSPSTVGWRSREPCAPNRPDQLSGRWSVLWPRRRPQSGAELLFKGRRVRHEVLPGHGDDPPTHSRERSSLDLVAHPVPPGGVPEVAVGLEADQAVRVCRVDEHVLPAREDDLVLKDGLGESPRLQETQKSPLEAALGALPPLGMFVKELLKDVCLPASGPSV